MASFSSQGCTLPGGHMSAMTWSLTLTTTWTTDPVMTRALSLESATGSGRSASTGQSRRIIGYASPASPARPPRPPPECLRHPVRPRWTASGHHLVSQRRLPGRHCSHEPGRGPRAAAWHHRPGPPPAGPALRVSAFDGSIVTLEEFRGRPAVVSFFESWCPICQVEQPDLSKVAKQFAGRVGFVAVSNHDTVAAGRAYARRFQVPYPLANDASGKTWARWRVPYQPVVVLVDQHGRIAERFDGGTTGGTLRAALTYLARE